MEPAFIVLIVIPILISLTISFFISRTAHRRLTKAANEYPLVWGIVVFVISAAVLLFVYGYLLINLVPFGR